MDLFGHKRAITVPITFDVIMKCKCVTCPVQANSACAKPKIMDRTAMVKNYEMTKSMNPEMMRYES